MRGEARVTAFNNFEISPLRQLRGLAAVGLTRLGTGWPERNILVQPRALGELFTPKETYLYLRELWGNSGVLGFSGHCAAQRTALQAASGFRLSCLAHEVKEATSDVRCAQMGGQVRFMTSLVARDCEKEDEPRC